MTRYKRCMLKVLLMLSLTALFPASPSFNKSTMLADDGEIDWKNIDGTRIPIPPPEHPRLYIRGNDAGDDIRRRLEDPVLEEVVTKLQRLGVRSPQFKIEWDALQYMADNREDEALGRRVVEDCLKFLRGAELPDRNDACRYTGRAMTTGAIVYDWLYPLLTADEKQAYIRELIRLAETQECGYPPLRQGSVTGHSSEAMIMREMISAGIAIYDETPEMYDLAAGRFFSEHLPVRNWLYNGHAYHQGDSYGPYRFGWDTFPLYIFDRLGAGNVYNPEQQYVPYFYMYSTRPDGQRLRAGDTFMHSRPPSEPWGEGIGPLLTASYYNDGVALGQFLRQGGNRDNELIFEFLWRDTDLEPIPREGLPLSRYFGTPFGWMIARTGWDDRAVVAEMKINEYNFANHQHLDAGAFQIYYRGSLAADTGLYTGSSGRYGSPHCRNYYWRTIAHNCMLVYDPDETFEGSDYGNDGGQRVVNGRREPQTLDILLDPENGYRTGRVLAQGMGPDPINPDFTLLEGDLTEAYGPKVSLATRSFAFLNLRDETTPAALVIFDRVVSANPQFQKTWLLHTLEEPRFQEAHKESNIREPLVVDRTERDGAGRLTLHTLLPEPSNSERTIIGGPGREFFVQGENFANDPEPGMRERSTMETGDWRIEISPRTPSRENLFLNVMLIGEQAESDFGVLRFESEDLVGCRIIGPRNRWLVLFPKEHEAVVEIFAISACGPSPTKVLVTGLAPGQWNMTSQTGPQDRSLTFEVSEESHAGWIELPSGRWEAELIE